MPQPVPVFRSAFHSAEDEFSGRGKRPVVFDIMGPDGVTSLLPDELKLVLHTNPNSMKIGYTKMIERIQTRGGWVEQHFGDATQTINFDMTTGGFMRLYTGMSSITNPTYGGTRRQTIAYEKYLDILRLFHNNASIFDLKGEIVFKGRIKISFDGGTYFGWFSSFSVEESAERPYQFSLTAAFEVDDEILSYRSTYSEVDSTALDNDTQFNSTVDVQNG